MLPLFSIVIPTYNYAPLLPRALDSIRSQDRDDYEVVVVDDGSTDNTREVVESYERKHPGRLTYAFHENRGLSATRNRGVELSKGRYLLFLDADDALLPSALDRFVAVMADHPDIEFVFGGHELAFEDGSILQRRARALCGSTSKNFARYVRKRMGTIAIGSQAVRRHVFKQITFSEKTYLGDYVFNCHALALCRCGSFPEPVVRIHRHAQSMSHNVDRMIQDFLGLADIIFDQEVLPSELLSLREDCVSQAYLSIFRFLYLLGRTKEAEPWYRGAILLRPANLLRLPYLRKYLRLILGMGPRSCPQS